MKTSMVFSPGSSLSKQPGYGEYRIWDPYLGQWGYAKTQEDANRMARNALIPKKKGTSYKIGFTQSSSDPNKSPVGYNEKYKKNSTLNSTSSYSRELMEAAKRQGLDLSNAPAGIRYNNATGVWEIRRSDGSWKVIGSKPQMTKNPEYDKWLWGYNI